MFNYLIHFCFYNIQCYQKRTVRAIFFYSTIFGKPFTLSLEKAHALLLQFSHFYYVVNCVFFLY